MKAITFVLQAITLTRIANSAPSNYLYQGDPLHPFVIVPSRPTPAGSYFHPKHLSHSPTHQLYDHLNPGLISNHSYNSVIIHAQRELTLRKRFLQEDAKFDQINRYIQKLKKGILSLNLNLTKSVRNKTDEFTKTFATLDTFLSKGERNLHQVHDDIERIRDTVEMHQMNFEQDTEKATKEMKEFARASKEQLGAAAGAAQAVSKLKDEGDGSQKKDKPEGTKQKDQKNEQDEGRDESVPGEGDDGASTGNKEHEIETGTTSTSTVLPKGSSKLQEEIPSTTPAFDLADEDNLTSTIVPQDTTTDENLEISLSTLAPLVKNNGDDTTTNKAISSVTESTKTEIEVTDNAAPTPTAIPESSETNKTEGATTNTPTNNELEKANITINISPMGSDRIDEADPSTSTIISDLEDGTEATTIDPEDTTIATSGSTIGTDRRDRTNDDNPTSTPLESESRNGATDINIQMPVLSQNMTGTNDRFESVIRNSNSENVLEDAGLMSSSFAPYIESNPANTISTPTSNIDSNLFDPSEIENFSSLAVSNHTPIFNGRSNKESNMTMNASIFLTNSSRFGNIETSTLISTILTLQEKTLNDILESTTLPLGPDGTAGYYNIERDFNASYLDIGNPSSSSDEEEISFV